MNMYVVYQHLWPKHLKERCPVGQELSQTECLTGLKAFVKNDKEVGDSGYLNINTYPFTPCGCHIWDHAKSNYYYLNFDPKTDEYKKETLPQGHGNILCKAPPPCFLTCNA